MQPGWKGRALVWAALMESARANRAKYPTLPTAWLPHAVGNSLLLAAPEWTAALDRIVADVPEFRHSPDWVGVRRAVRQICTENPAWGQYIMPLAFGYILSHPRFNIYQGEWGRMTLLGLGLDAIPHSVAGYALTVLVYDGLGALHDSVPPQAALSPWLRRLRRRRTTLSIALMMLLTAIWELGEYTMQQEELRRTGGDYSAINMQWDIPDAVADMTANMIGWYVATWQRTVS